MYTLPILISSLFSFGGRFSSVGVKNRLQERSWKGYKLHYMLEPFLQGHSRFIFWWVAKDLFVRQRPGAGLRGRLNDYCRELKGFVEYDLHLPAPIVNHRCSCRFLPDLQAFVRSIGDQCPFQAIHEPLSTGCFRTTSKLLQTHADLFELFQNAATDFGCKEPI